MYTYTYIYIIYIYIRMTQAQCPHGEFHIKKIEETDGSECVFIIGKYFITTNNFKKQKQKKNDYPLVI